MKSRVFVILILFCIDLFSAQKTNLAPSKPITDIYFGTKVVDDYRNLEDIQDPLTSQWMKSQTEYTNTILNKIPNRDYYLLKKQEFDKKQGYSISGLKVTQNNKYFYLKRGATEKIAKIYYRNGFDGTEELLYDPSNFISSFRVLKGTKSNFLINLVSPSWDGNRLAISLSEKGKEFSEIIIMDVNTRYIHPEIITNAAPANIGGVNWLEDNSGFFYINYPDIDTKSKLLNKNTQSVLYKIGENPKKLNVVFSKENNSDLKITEEKYPAILVFNPDDKYYIGMLVDADDYRTTYIIKKEDLLNGKKNWKPLYKKEDKVGYIRLRNDEIIFLSGYKSPNYKLCKTTVDNPDFIHPEVLIPEKKDEVIDSYALTKDGIYYTTTKNGIEAKLYLYSKGKETLIKLPYTSGNITLRSKGKDFSEIWVTCSGWANPEQRFKYDLKTNTFKSENLAPVIEFPEFKDVLVDEITFKSFDGTEVPLTLIYNKNIKRNSTAPVLIQSYGAYGESFYPFFSISYLLWANQGGLVALPHIRGGGEKGKAWHADGQKEKKPNSWKDLIASCEYLIDKKYTSTGKIAIWTASAGGITTGRAMTERPDLFGAVIIESGVLNILRNELGGVGGTSTQEYGSIKDPIGFKYLLEMDAYQHIKKGIKYPATFITTGINDSRVTPWQSTKFIAKLLANNQSDHPTLLRVDYEGGHGGDIPVIQRYSDLSDIFAFAFWQLGHPDYQPKEKNRK
ncbi:prolyl oligopeptidase family serine peptidase [Elizabethkingia anophelis]|uniref:prolyl oligopeptidase family serine peptidase n=1 Tax=Elizabethkingia anophelis TaxID=1117645 RepID=UPI0021A443D6|nr:prolyl oligopeptidase family serine peptidase [Elizabethkingia anophelis]